MIDEFLQSLLAKGTLFIGEVVVEAKKGKPFEIMHRCDFAGSLSGKDLDILVAPEEARGIAKYDQSGGFRPLKGAPNLKRGWRLDLQSIREVREALDWLYPGALATWMAFRQNRVRPVSFRETLARQSGMYRVTRHISTADANRLVGRFCDPARGCLRTILWRIDEKQAVTTLPASKFATEGDQEEGQRIPYLCVEGCNLLVSEARKVVKASV